MHLEGGRLFTFKCLNSISYIILTFSFEGQIRKNKKYTPEGRENKEKNVVPGGWVTAGLSLEGL